MNEKSVILADGTELDRKGLTPFHAKRGRGDPYALDAVYFQYTHQDTTYSDYLKNCSSESVGHVQLIDKKDLIAYLTGDISECPGLVLSKTKTSDHCANSATAAAGVLSTAAPTPTASSRKRSRAESGLDASDAAALSKVVRNQRCLDAVMIVSNCDFSALREKLGKEMEKLRTRASRSAANGGSRPSGSSGPKPTVDPRGDRYTAPVDRFWRENMGSDFYQLGIDPSKSFKSGSKPSTVGRGAGTASGSKTNGAQNPNRGQEGRNGRPPNNDQRVSTSGPPSGQRSSQSARVSGRDPAVKRSRFSAPVSRPIIIVPGASSVTSLLTLFNISDFLLRGVFITVKDLKQSGGGVQGMTSRITIKRDPAGSVPDGTAEYEVVSNPKKIVGDEWNRVVACVCTGQTWQFKDWEGYDAGAPDKGIPRILQKFCGFVFHYDDDARPPAAEKWPVTFVPLKRTTRNNDVLARMNFWEAIDRFCQLRRKNVRY